MTDYFWERMKRSLLGMAAGLVFCVVIYLILTIISAY